MKKETMKDRREEEKRMEKNVRITRERVREDTVTS